MIPAWKATYEQWNGYLQGDHDAAGSLAALSDTEREDCFYRDLEFGTGGLRGVLGLGTNRMNIYTVARATKGLADYLNEQSAHPSCAIAYDSRINSELFAKTAAGVLASQGVKAFLFPELMPTPILSFAVRHLGCTAGIVITASHNPAKYNGYKVYGSDGCQITLDAAEQIFTHMNQTKYFTAPTQFQPFFDRGEVHFITQDTLGAYYNAILALSVERPQASLQVVYSPLYGTGLKPVTHILQQLGNVSINVVPEQAEPDGNFPTCPYPNPEEKAAMQLSATLAAKTGADFCLATDPDCDRVGVGVTVGEQIHLISGNEIGVMLFDFVCKKRLEHGKMPKNPVAVKTIVTTEMAAAVACKYNVELRNVLTGFKFIGEQIGLLEKEGHPERYIFGFEESYGYLSGTCVRDKDAVNASMLICEMASYYKSQGKNLLEALDTLYQEYGYYQSELLSFAFEGSSGMKQMTAIMDQLRSRRPVQLAGKAVSKVIDYQLEETGLPKSNVLSFFLADDWHLVFRPSGTEPKLKLYLSVREKSSSAATNAISAFSDACRAYVASLS